MKALKALAALLCGWMLSCGAPPALGQVLPIRDQQGHPYYIQLGYDSVTGLSCVPALASPSCVVPGGGGGGGGGGGAVTAALGSFVDGFNPTWGQLSDPTAVDLTGNKSLISLMRGVLNVGLSTNPSPIKIDQTGTNNAIQFTAGATLPAFAATPTFNCGTGCGSAAVAQGSTTAGESGALTQCATLSASPTYTTATTNPCVSDTSGNLHASLYSGANAMQTVVTFSDAAVNAGWASLNVTSRQQFLNGTSWDRAFTCASTTSVSVTAGATTEIVSLTAAQVIRVCSFALGISANGSVGFYYGTGTNCGTGTTTLVNDVPLSTGTPFQQSIAPGSALFRTASANALCIKAVTGNVTGYITYAKF